MSSADRPDRPDQPDRVEHRAEVTLETTATPEEVWAAIATAEGISAWMVPTRLEPRTGGEVAFEHGALRSTGVVTDYTPGRRFAYEEPWPMTEQMRAWVAATSGHDVTDQELASISPIATEFLIEAASGGSCVVRVVSSSYGSGADWENEYFAEMVAGWGSTPFGPGGQTPWLDTLAAHLDASLAGRGALR